MERKEAIDGLLMRINALSRRKQTAPVSRNLRGEAMALHLLCTNPDMTPVQLGKTLEVTPPRVAAILDRLEEKGFLQRQTSAADRRRTLVRITEAGTRQELENRRLVRSRTEQLLAVLETEEIETLTRILDKLNWEDTQC